MQQNLLEGPLASPRWPPQAQSASTSHNTMRYDHTDPVGLGDPGLGIPGILERGG